MTDLTLCPVCMEGLLERQSKTGYAMINRKKVVFTTTYATCRECESEVMDYEDMNHSTNECNILKIFLDKELRYHVK